MPDLRRVKVVDGSNTYLFWCSGEVRRDILDDWPAPTPVSGAQDPLTRYLSGALLVKDIKSAYAHQNELRFGEHGGIIDHLADCELETRHGIIYLPPAENNPSLAGGAEVAIVAGATDDASRPGAVTTANKNPKAAVYYAGTVRTGVFTWSVLDNAANDYTLTVNRFDGTNFISETDHVISSAFETLAGYDMVVHKGAICFFHSNRNPINSAGIVARSTTGDTLANMANSPTANARSGSRLVSFRDTLYAISNVSTGTGTFESITIEKTTDNGGTAWTSVLAGHSGVLRDWALFQRDDVEEIFLLMNDGLYWFDRTNSILNKQPISLPAQGRALIPFHVNGVPALLIYMDGMKRYAYFANGSSWDISPGGSQGMPSGKDFGLDADGQVCVTASAWGVYQLWSGKDNGGTVLRPLCLFFDGRVELKDGKVVATGDHFVWRKADTSISSAARFVVIDPESQDLLLAVQDAINFDTTIVRLKDIEVPPSLQTTKDRKTSGYMTLSRLDFGDPSVSTTIWSAFLHTTGLGTNETIAVKYGIDGDAATTVTVGTASAQGTTLKFPDNSANAAGTNFTDIQMRLDFAADAVTDLPGLYALKINYLRTPALRTRYTLDFIVSPQRGVGRASVKKQIADLKTILAKKTKVLVTFSEDEGQVLVLPGPPMSARERLGDPAAPASAPRSGIWRIGFIEA